MMKTLDSKIQTKIAEALKPVLAESVQLYVLTQNVHWNVTGPMFGTLHTLFETQYTELAVAVDEIAERIRTLGEQAPGGYQQFAALSEIEESPADLTADAMIRILSEDQLVVAKIATQLTQAAAEAGDEATASIASDRVVLHEKNAWMIRSHIE